MKRTDPLQPCVRRRKIFVIKQTGRLLTAGGPGKKIRRILVFDDHPDSLRLVFTEVANRPVYPTPQKRAGSRQLILPGLALIVGLAAAMLWPLF